MNKEEFIKSTGVGSTRSWYMDVVSVPILNKVLYEHEDFIGQFQIMRKVEEKEDWSYIQETYILSTHKLYRIVIKKDTVDIEAVKTSNICGFKFLNTIRKDLGHRAVPSSLVIRLASELNGNLEVMITPEEDSRINLSYQEKALNEFASAISSVIRSSLDS